MDDLFTVKDVSRIFGMNESKLRYWAQTGFINPSVQRGTRRYYTFSDLIAVKTAKELLDSGMTLQKVRKNLDALRDVLPQFDQPLSKLRVRSDGDRIVVVADEVAFEAETHQTVMEFRTVQLRDEVTRMLSQGRAVADTAPSEPPAARGSLSAYQWFQAGLECDQADETITTAEENYRRALDQDPEMAAAHTNLGNICYRTGRVDDARVHYEQALNVDPDQPEARFNLANIYEEEGKTEQAIAEYRRVVSAHPDFPDAHFNLALALERVGSRVQSSRHFSRYLELDTDKDSVWAKMAESHLKRLSS